MTQIDPNKARVNIEGEGGYIIKNKNAQGRGLRAMKTSLTGHQRRDRKGGVKVIQSSFVVGVYIIFFFLFADYFVRFSMLTSCNR